MADVVLGRILRPARVQQFPHAMLKFERVMAFGDDIVLVENVAEEVAIVELMMIRFETSSGSLSNQSGSFRRSATSRATISSTSRRWIAR